MKAKYSNVKTISDLFLARLGYEVLKKDKIDRVEVWPIYQMLGAGIINTIYGIYDTEMFKSNPPFTGTQLASWTGIAGIEYPLLECDFIRESGEYDAFGSQKYVLNFEF